MKKETKKFIEETKKLIKFYDAQSKRESQARMKSFGARNRPAKVRTQSAHTFSRVKCC